MTKLFILIALSFSSAVCLLLVSEHFNWPFWLYIMMCCLAGIPVGIFTSSLKW